MGTNNRKDVQYMIITDEDGNCAEVLGGNFVVSPVKFSAKVVTNIIPISLNVTTDSSLFSFTGEGKLDFIALAGSRSGYEAILKIDGVEVYRLPMDDISTIGLTGSENETIYNTTASKNFRDIYPEGADFLTSFEILAKQTGGAGTDISASLIKFREKITGS